MSAGWAAGEWPRRQLLSHVRFGVDDPEPAFAIVDAWEPPNAMALPADLCDRLVESAAGTRRIRSGNGDYHPLDLEPDDEQAILDRFREANAQWWGLELDRWDVHAKRYRVGDRHAEHQDLHPGAARRGAMRRPRRVPSVKLRRSSRTCRRTPSPR